MRPVAEQLRRVLGAIRPTPPTDLPPAQALGCVLAQDVIGVYPLPGFDNSAMDGYAVRAADVAIAGSRQPVRLTVAGDIAAGDTRRHVLPPGQSLRIMTGAPMPDGADAVVPVELTDGATGTVTILTPVQSGQHLRRAGEDIQAGAVVLRAGTRVGPRQLALAASAGAARLRVHPRPRVAVVSTGDELVQPGTEPAFGQVIDSNGPMLIAALVEAGFAATLVTGVRDTAAEVIEALHAIVGGPGDAAGASVAEPPGFSNGPAGALVDAVVTTGGVSMGAYDAVKEALTTLGTVEFTQVAMQPGKPQGFGVIGDRAVPVFTLPGNPVSALVSLEVFVAPALRVMAGRPAFEVALQQAVAAHDFGSPPGKVQFARVVVDRAAVSGDLRDESCEPDHPWRDPIRRPPPVALAGAGQGSHMFGGLAEADALAVVPAAVSAVRAGDALTCLPLSGGWWG